MEIKTADFKSGDARISFREMGSGPPVVFLHPFPSSHELWLPVAEKLADSYRVVLPDLRAHGRSGTGEGPATMQRHADDVALLCRELKIGKAVFCGISIGGYILFEFWRSHRPQVKALILCDTKASPDSAPARADRLRSAEDVLERGPADFISRTLPKLLGETTQRNRPDLVEAARHTMRYATAESIAAAQRGMAERADSVPLLPGIDVPVQIIAGEEDSMTPRSEMEAMHQKIPGSAFAVIPQAGHYSVFEQPEDALRIIRAFLHRLPR